MVRSCSEETGIEQISYVNLNLALQPQTLKLAGSSLSHCFLLLRYSRMIMNAKANQKAKAFGYYRPDLPFTGA